MLTGRHGRRSAVQDFSRVLVERARVAACAVLLVGCGDGASTPEADPSEVPVGPPTAFGVMTFNVLCSFCDGSYDPWAERLGHFDDIFERYEPDLIGLQEISFESEVTQFLELLPGFASSYFGQEEGVVGYPDATILYRTNRFRLLSRGDYWLSPTPDVASSKGFAASGNQLPRLVTWVELLDLESGREIYFASTHVDNNTPSQELSAPLILERTAPWQERVPAVVIGDFNSQTDDRAFEILTQGTDDYPAIHDTQPLAATSEVVHNLDEEPDYDYSGRIDYLFIAPRPADWTVERWAVDLHVYGPDKLFPSDHRAMYSRVTPPVMVRAGWSRRGRARQLSPTSIGELLEKETDREQEIEHVVDVQGKEQHQFDAVEKKRDR